MLEKEISEGSYKNSKKFVRSSLSFLKKKYEKERIPQILVKKIKFMSYDSYSASLITVPNYSHMMYHSRDEIQNLRGFSSFQKSFKENILIQKHLNKMVYTSLQGRTFGLEYYIDTFLLNMVQSAKEFELDEEMFNKVYKDYFKSLRQREFYFKAYIALKNFESEIDKINIDKDIVLRKIEKEEYEEFGSTDVLSSSPFIDFDNPFIFIRYLIEVKFKDKKNLISPTKAEKIRKKSKLAVPKIINDIITCIRIIEPSFVTYDKIKYQQYNNTIFNFGYSTGFPSTIGMYGKKCFLKKDKTEELIRLYGKFKSLNFENDKKLLIAIQRYNIAQERTRPVDKLIDYIISLEALLIKGDQKVFQRLPQLVANELNKDFDKKIVTSQLKQAISCRNAVLHARKSDLDIKEIEEEVGIYTSSLIKKYIMDR